MITSLQREAELRESVRSSYDKKFDEEVFEVYRKLEEFFVTIERAGDDTSAISYHQYSDFYADIELDLSILRIRASARPGNDLTVGQLRILTEEVLRLEKHHRKEGFRPPFIKEVRKVFSDNFSSILQTEMAKIRREPIE